MIGTVARLGLARLVTPWIGRPEPAVVTDDAALSWSGLQDAMDQAAGALRPLVGAGDVVGLAIADPIAFVVLLLALSGMEASVFLIQDGLAAAELGRLVAHERAALVLTDRALAGIGWASPVVLPLALPLAGAGVRLHRAATPGARVAGEPAVHLYTSGTEGRLKGVVRPAATLLAEARSIVAMLGLAPGLRVLAAVPPSHAYGLGMGLLGPLAGGATAVMVRPATPRAFAAAVARHRPDAMIAVPAQYDVWSRIAPQALDPALLRLCVSSGAALPASIAAAFRASWGRGLARQYGMSECGPIAIDLEDRPEPDCVGRAYPGVELRIEAGTGEILLRTPSAASGFVGGAQEPPAARLLRTGDTGRLDAEGRLFLDARRALQINVHGRKLDPAEVEEAIRAIAGVSDVAVVGIPTPGGDDRVAALVVGKDVGVAAVEDACRARLAAWKMPRQVVIATAVPRTAAGKPDRTRIAAVLAAG